MPWWLKVLFGFGLAGAIVYFLEIEELLMTFWWAVCIPMMFLYSLGLVGEGTYEAVTDFLPNIMEDLRNRIDYYYNKKKLEVEHTSAP